MSINRKAASHFYLSSCRATLVVVLFILGFVSELHAAISFRSAATSSVTGGNITINVPAGTAADDVMVAVIGHRDNPAVTITPPAGWTSQSRIPQPTNNESVQEVFTRVATGSEPASYTWVFSAAINGAVGGILSYSGVDTASVVDVIGGNVTANGTSHTVNSVTTTVANAVVISAHNYASSEVWTPPAGAVDRVNIASATPPQAGGIALIVSDETQAVAGATGNKTATVAGNADPGVGHILALTPAPTGGGGGYTGVCDDFDSGVFPGTEWTFTGNAALGTRIVNSAPNSLETSGGGTVVTSRVMDTSAVTNLVFDVWINRGQDGISENPDGGEDLEVEYFNDSGVWTLLENFPGGPQGGTFTRAYNLPADAQHAGFQIRFSQLAGTSGFDFWHIDDVCITGDADALALAEWRMDEATWTGAAGEVIDEIGSFNATALNNAQTAFSNPAIPGDPGTCGYGTFPSNTSTTPPDAVDTGLNIDTDVGNAGTITMWYYSNADWNGGGERQLLDAGFSGAAGGAKYFFLTLLNTGELRFGYEDDADGDWRINSPVQSFVADEWVHIAVNWDLPNDTLAIFINGTQVASATTSSTGVLGELSSLFIGDNNGDYIIAGDTTPNSANGGIDEVRVYDAALDATEVMAIMSETHDCPSQLFFEVDQVTLNDTTTNPTFTSVNFRQTYPGPPLVFVVPTQENPDPVAIRIRNVTTTGFELAQVEPLNQDGRSVPLTVDYIAITEGVFTLPDGRTIEAGTHTTTTVQHGNGVPGAEAWDVVNYTSTYTAPSVLLQIQEFANETANPPATTSQPWLTASIRNVGNTSFETALERSEVNDVPAATIATDETIAYLAIDGNVQGSFAAQGTTILYESINSADNIAGWFQENCDTGVGQSIGFVNTYSTTPLAIAHTRRHDGGDGGWVRRCSIDATQIGLGYEEDIFRDTERNHTNEQASIFVFSEAFCFPTCTADIIDHYDIDFGAGSGITCLPVDVTITAKDSSNNTVNHNSLTPINFETSTLRGTWGSTPSAGSGTVIPGGSGAAQYGFPAGESSVTLPLNYPDLAGATSETFQINITSVPNETTGTAPGDIDPGDGTDDPTIDFFLTGIIVNNVTDGNNTIATQISGKPSDTGFNAKALNLQVVRATDNDPSVCTSIFGLGVTVSIELGAECKTPDTCAGRELNISNAATPSQNIVTSDDDGDDDNADSVASYEAVNLQFGTDSAAGIVLTYPDAGTIQLHARYELLLDDGTPSGEYATGISNNFVVRPFGFAIGLIQDAGASANPGAVDATGGVFVKAGEDFSFSVGAFNWGSGDDDGSSCDAINDPGCAANDGIPDTNADLFDNNGGGSPAALTPNFVGTGAVDVSFSAVAPFAPAAGTLGTLTESVSMGTPLISAASFSAGIASISTVYYTEVGTMTLRASASDYLGTGQGIAGRSSNLASNPGNGSVGRFIPDRFLIVSDGGPALLNACTAGNFTYMDESFTYDVVPAIELQAVNTYDSPTVNYGDGGTAQTDFWKLPTALARSYDDNAVNNGSTFVDDQGATVTISGEDDFTDGRGVLSITNVPGFRDTFVFGRSSVDIGAGEGAPFTASIDVLIQVTAGSLYDPDSSGSREVCYDGDGDGNCEFDGSDDYTALTDTGGTALSLDQLRFGRLIIGTSVGSELLPIAVPLQTQIFNGTEFVTHAADVCTSIADSDLLLSNLIAAGPGPTITITTACGGSGVATATIANDPFDAGDAGLSFLMASPAEACTGYSDITIGLGSIASWLQYEWDDDGNDDGPYDDDPTGRVDFGLFDGPNEYIYIREPW